MGVYKCGSAKLQEDYDKHVNKLFSSLDRVTNFLAVLFLCFFYLKKTFFSLKIIPSMF